MTVRANNPTPAPAAPPAIPVISVIADGAVAAVVSGIAAGDTRALAEFYEERFDRAFDMARSLTRRDESFCLDVVQDAMLKVIRTLSPRLRITTRESLDAWFARVVHTTAIDHLRREARRRRRELAPAMRRSPDTSHPGAAELAEIDERICWLVETVSGLDAEAASMVSMRIARGRSLEAVGKEHNMSLGAAHGKLRRLFDRLRRSGKERFHD